MEVPAQGRDGEETHKCLDVTGPDSNSHHRDQPTEFHQKGKGRASRDERGSRREKPKSPSARKGE